jgi:cytochrome c oxidase subunit IV
MRFSKSDSYGINKTVGWAYDLSGFSFFVMYFLIAFFIGFCLIAIIRAKTNLILSVFFFLCISFCCLFQDGYHNIRLIDNILIISILIFIILFIHSVFTKIKSLLK